MARCRSLRSGVFPAYAGMFPAIGGFRCGPMSFPRIRGDVPHGGEFGLRSGEFSPHTRGCSSSGPHQAGERQVFPAYAGMFLPGSRLSTHTHKFSPHTRGCSSAIHRMPDHGCVFPAYAGMFLREGVTPPRGQRFPRIRGDVPRGLRTLKGAHRFSPHTRGCSGSGYR